MIVRDFLYLDVDRVRSLLAHLERGVVETTVERLTESREARAGASFFRIFDLAGSLVQEDASEQTKTLSDALYLLFEEAALTAGLFDTGVALDNADSWEQGTIHDEIDEGRLLRFTAPTRILDSRHFRQRVERFAGWPRLIASFNAQDELAKIKSAKERERRLEHLAAASMGGAGAVETIGHIAEFVELFMGGQISLRQFPCGLAHREFAFVAMLLDKAGYLQEDREALFAKYGSMPSAWTLVSQVATVPPQTSEQPDLEITDLVNEAEEIDRSQFEELGVNLMQLLEQTGIAEGPSFPAIAVTPLAVYREVNVASPALSP